MTYEDGSFINETPTPRKSIVTPASLLIDDGLSIDADISGMSSTSGLDDTFDFRRNTVSRAPVADQFPGSFLGDETDASYEEASYDEEEEGDVTMNADSFLGDGSVGSVDEEEPAEPVSEEEDEVVDDQTMIVDDEDDGDTVGGHADEDTPHKFIMAADMSPSKSMIDTPKALPMGKDWTEQLNNTISPVKRRFGGESFFAAGNKSASPRKFKMEPLNYGLLDLANDLYASPSKMNGNVRKDVGKTRKRDEFEV